jgi:hypothetical protein
MKKVFLVLVCVVIGVIVGYFIKQPAVVTTCDCNQEAMESGLHDCRDWAKLRYEAKPNSTPAEIAAAKYAELSNADATPKWTGPRLCKETAEYGRPQDVFSLNAVNHRVSGKEDIARELLPTGKLIVVECIPDDPRKIQGREIYGVDPETKQVVLKTHAG